MMKLYYWIDKSWKRDISEKTENFQIYRTVFSAKGRAEDILKNKEAVLKEIPFCSVIDSLEQQLKQQVSDILEDDNDMTDLCGFNMQD